MEHLTGTVLGIYTQGQSIITAIKKDNLRESEVDQLILDLGRFARLILDFERSNRLILLNKDIDYS